MFYENEILLMAVELKYCERCGGLYVRRSGSRTTLCLSCVEAERALGFGPKPSKGRMFDKVPADEGEKLWSATAPSVVAGGVA